MAEQHPPTKDRTASDLPQATVIGREHNGRAWNWNDGRTVLNPGDRLSRPDFERRYEARPDIKKAELIEGVVYMPSPVYLDHGEPHGNVMVWLGVYRSATPNVRLADNTTLRLDLDNEPQPDAILWIDEKAGGRAIANKYLEGAPELIVEVAATSAAYDLHDKLRAYRRNSVQEYLVLIVYEQKIIWYNLQDGEYVPLEADETGTYHSRVFPGLWLRPELFWQGDLAGVLAAMQEGLASPEHAAFAAQLTEMSRKP